MHQEREHITTATAAVAKEELTARLYEKRRMPLSMKWT
jgi:hypothetical protein